MRLLEFFGQINELRSRIFSRDNDDGSATALYGSRYAKIPTHLFVSSDGSDLKYADDIYVVSPQPAKLKKFKSEILDKRFNKQEVSSSDEAYLTMINSIEKLTLTGEQVRTLGKILPAKITELNGRSRIFKYLTTDLGLPASIYNDHFGETPEMDEAEFTQFHNARLIVPDTIKPASLKAAIKILELVYQYLDKAGEVDVFGGVIRFAKLPRTTAGEYSPSTHDITVNQNLNAANMSGLFTLLHEYAHKKMFELMTPEAVKEIENKFSDLEHSGESHSNDIDFTSAVYAAIEQLQPGLQLTYIGRQQQYKQNPNYVIKEITPGYANLAQADEPDTVRVKYPVGNLFNPKKWKAEGVDLTPPMRKPQHEAKSSDWFPSDYSQTNYKEWWAELYPYYILGNLSGEPAAWMQGMLHGNTTTETVGSNDGEISSEGDPMPPPQRGDEEGKPEWEWTDPYHSSGTENAVLSNTP
jgi:hypothetical protein